MPTHMNRKFGTIRTILQKLSRSKERFANKERLAPEHDEAVEAISEAVDEQKEVRSTYANTAAFWSAYTGLQPGKERRRVFLSQIEDRRLPVDCKWQASTQDPDLRYLLKKGILTRVRDGGGAQHHMNKSTAKRQTFLVLAEEA